MSRNVTALALAVLAAFTLSLSLVAGYLDRAIFDPDQFANRATAAIENEAVREQLAIRITDDLVLAADRDLIGLRPLIETTTSTVIGSRPFLSLLRAAIADLHRALFEKDEDTVTLTLADVGVVVAGVLEAVAPQAAKRIGDRDAIVLELDPPDAGGDTLQRAEELGPLAWILLGLAVAAIVGGLLLCSDRREVIVLAGSATAAWAILLVIALRAVRLATLDGVHDPDQRAAAAGIFDAFLGDLRTGLLLLAGAGATVSAAAASVLRPVDIREPLRRALALVTAVPKSPSLRGLRALALILVGVAVITRRDLVLELIFVGAGAFLVYAGLTELLRLIPGLSAEEAEAIRAQRRRTRRRIAGVALATTIAALLIAGGGAAYVATGGLSEDREQAGACNGRPALCDRTLGEVTLAGTHNAMSAASEPGWLFANHEAGVAAQLESGVHALLWDTHYGIPTRDGTIYTDLGDISNFERRQYEEEIGEQAVDAALRIRERIGGSATGERGVYLCHRFCELGATPLARGLEEVRDYLLTHPDDVLVVVNEDYVDPADYVRAVREAGLADYAHTGPTDPFPTLREMIDSGRRLVLVAEKEGGGAPWYRAGYEAGILQETPYSFDKPALLTDPRRLPASCRPNRGGRTGTILLLNHWIDTSPAPRPSNAARVNTAEALQRRARECARNRGQPPGIVAVDFFRTGDLFGAVDTLNGARRSGDDR